MKDLRLYEAEENDCWATALGNYFNISPKKIPSKCHHPNNKSNYIDETRKWLSKKKKGIIYVPLNCFLYTTGENSDNKYNKKIYPDGKCIVALLSTDGSGHACLMIDGTLYQKDDGKYDVILGYFIIYDLNSK